MVKDKEVINSLICIPSFFLCDSLFSSSILNSTGQCTNVLNHVLINREVVIKEIIIIIITADKKGVCEGGVGHCVFTREKTASWLSTAHGTVEEEHKPR